MFPTPRFTQDPMLVQGSLRHNLDPTASHSDEKLWKALEKTHMSEFVGKDINKLLLDVGESGTNLRFASFFYGPLREEKFSWFTEHVRTAQRCISHVSNTSFFMAGSGKLSLVAEVSFSYSRERIADCRVEALLSCRPGHFRILTTRPLSLGASILIRSLHLSIICNLLQLPSSACSFFLLF